MLQNNCDFGLEHCGFYRFRLNWLFFIFMCLEYMSIFNVITKSMWFCCFVVILCMPYKRQVWIIWHRLHWTPVVCAQHVPLRNVGSSRQWVNCGSWSKGSKPSKYWQPTIGILKKCIMTWVPSPQTPFAAHLSCSNFRISLLIYIFSNAQTTVWLTHLPRAVQRLGKALTDASTIHSGFHGKYRLQVLHIPASAMHDKKPCLACSENLFFGTFHRTGLYYCSNGRSKSVGGRIERWATSKYATRVLRGEAEPRLVPHSSWYIFVLKICKSWISSKRSSSKRLCSVKALAICSGLVCRHVQERSSQRVFSVKALAICSGLVCRHVPSFCIFSRRQGTRRGHPQCTQSTCFIGPFHSNTLD